MTPDNSLIIGIVLVGIALILAFLAYYILTSGRGEEEIDEEKEDVVEPDEVTPELETIGGEPEEPSASQEAEVASVEEALEIPSPEAEVQPEPSSEGYAARQEPLQDGPELEAAQLELPKAERGMAPVATLMRDEVTGRLIVQVGDHEYTNADELKASEDWNRVEYATSELTKWLTSAAPVERIPERERDQFSKQPPSMIEQINEILQQQLADEPEANKAVRLIEGPGGTVRVFVGVHSYAIDEVPDPSVQQVIREAVAEWEENQ